MCEMGREERGRYEGVTRSCWASMANWRRAAEEEDIVVDGRSQDKAELW
jgi:hypothetical protein